MKIVSILSSARKKGNTYKIISNLEKELLDIGAKKNVSIEIENIQLAYSDIQFCRGCRICFDKGEELCPIKDELLNIRDKINSADGIILASPVYVEDINGIMKNWIDRMAFNCHRPAFAGKSAVVITTSGIGSSNHALRTMKTALQTWGFNICAQGKFRAGAHIENEKINILYKNKIGNIAEKLYGTIIDHRYERPSFYSLMAFRVQQKYWEKNEDEKNTFDYFYWENKGWLKNTCDYYIEHDSNFIKTRLAKLAGDIIAIFFV